MSKYKTEEMKITSKKSQPFLNSFYNEDAPSNLFALHRTTNLMLDVNFVSLTSLYSK